MSAYLPKEIREQLAACRRTTRRRRATRVIHVGGEAFAIFDMTDDGFTVEAPRTSHLRGLIDIYEGPRHLCTALIVAAERDGDLMRYDFKRSTAAMHAAPVDFERQGEATIPLLSNV